MRQAGKRGQEPLLSRKALNEIGEGLEGLPFLFSFPTDPDGKTTPPSWSSWSGRATDLATTLAKSPETSGHEFRSSRLLASFLNDAGFKVTRGLPSLPTAFLASKGDPNHPRVCLVVEFDAIPGLGQACGHNLNAAISLLAAAMLAPMTQAARGSLLLTGTPDEERRGAKAVMVRQGVFTGVGLALLLHAGAWKSRLHYRTSAFRSLLLHPGENGTGPQYVLERLTHGMDNGETARLRTERDGHSLRLDILAPSASRHRLLVEQARNLLTLQGIPFTPDAGEEPLEPFLANEPAAKKLNAIWQEMGIPFDDSPIWLGSSDMGNLSHSCPTHQSVLAVTDRPLAWHTTTFADVAGGTDLSQAILVGALSLVKLSLLFWQDKTFRQETARAFLAGKALRRSS